MTELVWDGKYVNGKKTAPIRLPLPFQTVETVNESIQQRQMTLDLFASGRPTEWRNRLIWGDKKYVLPSLLPEFAGQVNLIYIDPPFATGADFSFTASIPESENSFIKEPSVIEQKAYRDTWGKGLDSYLQWFYETVVLLRELLTEDGSIYVHLDWHVGHYAKAILDEVFGSDNFQNEICWKRSTSGSAKARAKKFGADHDTLFFYSKSLTPRFNQIYTPYPEDEIQKRFRNKDDRGYFKDAELATYSPETLQRLKQENRLITTQSGKYRYKIYLEEIKGVLADSVWTDIPIVNSQAEERADYATQKPEALLERIINASSNENDLILDCFCGSGTTATVAEKLNRRWITCDLGRFAIHTARKRLLSIPGVRPFVVQNLGKYERQAWQKAEFGDTTAAASLQARYRNFILQLYHASPLEGYNWLHGVKGGKLVHVGSVDAPIALGEVKAIAAEFWRVTGKDAGERSNEVDILGWDFAFDLNETAKQMAADSNIKVAFKKIPREVLEKKAVEQGDIRFYELAALAVDCHQQNRHVNLELKNFFVSPDDIPDDIQQAISHWSQWIDYWAVDWDYQDDTFHNQWQSYRTKKDPKILLTAGHEYSQPGCYTVVIKVIDILGNDTTKAIQIEIS